MKFCQMSIASFAAMFVCGLLGTQAVLVGQVQTNQPQPTNESQESQEKDSNSREQSLTSDRQNSDAETFAKCLAITNQEQVKFARFAKEKTQNPDVKAYAAMLEKGHQGCLDKLGGLIAGMDKAVVEDGACSEDKVSKSVGFDFLQIHQELADQCLIDSKETLNAKAEGDFDKCFVGMQIAKHAMMQTSLTVLQRHATDDLQAFMKDSQKKNAEHMQASLRLMEKLSSNTPAKTARISKQ